jgi:hypothetical protein
MAEIREEEIARAIVVEQPYHGGRYIIAYKGESLTGWSYPSAETAQAELDDICAALLQPALERARREERERAGAIAAEWAKPQTMKLHAGEMTAGEVRTTSAVLRGLAAAIRKG